MMSLKRTVLGGLAVLVAAVIGRTSAGSLGAGVLLGALAGTAVLFAVAKDRRGDLAIVPVPPQHLALWTLAALALTAAFDLAAWATGRPLVEPEWRTVFAAEPTWLLAAALIATSLFEELYFRGWLLGGLGKTRLKPAGAAALVTLLFAAVHFPGDAWRAADVLASGALLAAMRLKTGSSLPGMLPHVLGNLKVLALLAATSSGPSPPTA